MKFFNNLEVYPTAVGYCISWDYDKRVKIGAMTPEIKTDGKFVHMEVPYLWGLEIHNVQGLSPEGCESLPYIKVNGELYQCTGSWFDEDNGTYWRGHHAQSSPRWTIGKLVYCPTCHTMCDMDCGACECETPFTMHEEVYGRDYTCHRCGAPDGNCDCDC